MTASFPYIFTFYSFKGGVGRSMALLNVAYTLSERGRHVLILDMDLEAPGISGYMRRTGEIGGQTERDAIDLVAWACSAADCGTGLLADDFVLPQPDFQSIHMPVPIEKRTRRPRYGEVGRIDVIGVDIERDYFARLNALNLSSKTRDELIASAGKLRGYLRALTVAIDVPEYYGPEAPRTQPYDYVLVDSRTGTTEVGGLCVGPLSDRLVVVTALNDQNIHGTRKFLDELGLLTRREDVHEPWDDADPPADESDAPPRLAPKPTFLVASPVPYGEIEVKRQRLEEAERALGQKIAAKLSYHPQLALMESIFVRDYREEPLAEEYRDLSSHVLRAVKDHPDQLISFSFLHMNEKFQALAIEAMLRAVAARPQEVFTLASMANSFNPKSEPEFALADRMFRVLAEAQMPQRHAALNDLAANIGRWANATTDTLLRHQRLQEVVAQCTALIELEDLPQKDRVSARINRGIAFSKMEPPRTEEEIADYTAVVEMADAPPEQRARALIYRGVTYGQMDPPRTEEEIADYTAIIDMADAPPEQRARALINRGGTYGHMEPPRIEQAIADCTAVIEMADAPPEPRATALFNRGVLYEQMEPPRTQEAIADYTAVIGMADAPPEQRENAFGNLGWLQFLDNRLEESAASSRDALKLVPTRVFVRANLALALLCLNQTDEALAEYQRAIENADEISLLDEMETDLRDTLNKRGQLAGAKEALESIAQRRHDLETKSPQSRGATTSPEHTDSPSSRTTTRKVAKGTSRKSRKGSRKS